MGNTHPGISGRSHRRHYPQWETVSPDLAAVLLPGSAAAGGELSSDVAALHEGGLPDLAVDEEVVEGERRQRQDARRDQLEVASTEREEK